MEYQISLPAKIKTISEDDFEGVYEIEGLHPGYGYTVGHSIRRIILSSLPGASITKVKIEGVNHEFSTLPGVKEDVINIILNLKQVRFKMYTDDPQTFSTIVKGVKKFTAGDLNAPTQLEVTNKDFLIADLTNKDAVINLELTVEKGLGYVPKELLHKDKTEIGTISVDAIFSPIRKINYEVINMRVGEKTDYNRLKFYIETDGTIKPKEALEVSFRILIEQMRAALGENMEGETSEEENENEYNEESRALKDKKDSAEGEEDVLKIRVEDLDVSTRTLNALTNNGIRTIGGLVKKRETDLLSLEGLGEKAIKETRKALGKLGLSLKD